MTRSRKHMIRSSCWGSTVYKDTQDDVVSYLLFSANQNVALSV